MLKSILTIASVLLLFSCTQEKAKEREELIVKPLIFELDTISHYGQPYLYTNQQGEVLMSFIETKDEKAHLLYTKLKNNTWTEPNLIAQGTDWFVNWADYPQISSFAESGLLSFFLQKSGDGVYSYDIKLTHSEEGADWTEPNTLHDDGQQAEHGFVSFVPFQTHILAAWLDGRNTGGESDADHHGHHEGAMTLRAALVNNKGQKEAEWELDDRVCDCCQTSSALTTNGPVIVYRNRSEGEIRDIAIVRYLDGKWTSPRPVYPDNWKIPGCPVNGPRVDGKDNLLGVAWFAAPQGQGVVKVAFSENSGERFLQPVTINTGTTIGRVDFALIEDSSGIVSWMEGTEILARKVTLDGQLGPVVHIATSSDQRSSGFPQMTKGEDEMVFAWTDSQSKKSQIRTATISIDAF
ncbi:exo-alpha-sialidase [Litoribacter populi]|uniref:exo-alpha-sialidase n=1 Tax=Litoribacter populi TaxID=2598460 RepID=UPI00117CE357|nr:exo-alpha-sialidase [Litoribacter populi]